MARAKLKRPSAIESSAKKLKSALARLLILMLVVINIPKAQALSTTNGTLWYLRSTTASAAFGTTGPTAEQSAASDLVSTSPTNKTIALAMTDTPGTLQTSVAGTETSTSAGNIWFRTFLSPKLAAQTINSGTTFRFESALMESSTSANMIFRIHVYQYREGTGKIASLIDNVSATACGVEPGAASSERSQVCITAGTAASASLLANDQLALEVWVNANNTSSTSYTGTMYFEGTAFVGNGTASHVVTTAESTFWVSQTLALVSSTSNSTTWYLRSTTAASAFGTPGPAAEQSAASDLDASSPTNKTTALAMTDTPAASQTSVAGTETSTSAGNIWFRTFLSPKLAAQTISAGATFRFEGALMESSTSANMTFRLHVYQWREGTGYIASLIDDVGATNCGVEPGAASSERSEVCVTVATASAATLLDYDQLALEVWVYANNTSGTSYTGTMYFEGTAFVEAGTASYVMSSARSLLSITPVVTLAPAGSLDVDVVDSDGSSVGSPSVTFGAVTFSFDSQTSTGTLGADAQRIRITNTTDTQTWTLSIAATSGSAALWSTGALYYDYNDLSGASDGSDADSYGGQLTIDPSTAAVAAVSTCTTTTGISKGSSNAFSETAPIVSSITLATGGSTSSTNCKWDITGISLSQAIPAVQSAGTYTLSFTLTVV